MIELEHALGPIGGLDSSLKKEQLASDLEAQRGQGCEGGRFVVGR